MTVFLQERWGTRFPDMSNTYDAAWRQALVASASAVSSSGSESALLIPSVVLGHMADPQHLYSSSAATMLRSCGAQVACAGLVPQV